MAKNNFNLFNNVSDMLIADYSTVVNKKSKGSRSFADLFGTK